MKTILFVVIAFVAVTLFGVNRQATAQATSKNKDSVEVLYFHGKQRCITCNAIEKWTREVIEKYFAQEVKEGKLKFRVIDISKKENEKIVEKYEVTWSSLFINKWKDGKERVNNMTKFGFSYAKNSPEVFKEGIKKKIQELLK